MNTLKRRSLRPSFLLLAAACASLLVPRGAHAGMPQPSAIYYGQARDEYGWPYREGAVVILRAGTNEIVRHAISGSLAPGINFMLPAPIDDGRDAAPYVRVFNPITQGRRFDPDGDYVRRHVSELAHVPGAAAHEPWDADGGYAHGYPQRIVDHAAERREALRRFHEVS